MAGKPIDYGQTFTHNGEMYVQIMDKRHCSVCDFWYDGGCKADDDVPACLSAPIAFIKVKIPTQKEGKKK